jgi:hypothetical protein
MKRSLFNSKLHRATLTAARHPHAGFAVRPLPPRDAAGRAEPTGSLGD